MLLYFLSIGTLREMAVELAGRIIVQVVERESNGFYHVSFDEIEIDLFRKQLDFSNFQLNVDSVRRYRFEAGTDSRTNMYITHIPVLTMRIRSLYDLYLNRNLEVEAISFRQPDIKWYKSPREQKQVTLSLEAGDFYQLVTDYLNHFEITDFKITDGYFTYVKNVNAPEQTYLVGPVNASVENFEIGQESGQGTTRFLNTEKLRLQISDQTVKLADSIHVVAFDDLMLSTETSDIVFTNLKLKPRVEKLPVPDSLNSYEVLIPQFRLTDVDFIKAYVDNHLEIGGIKFEEPAININEVNRAGQRRGQKEESESIVELLTSLFDVIEVKNFDLDRALLDLKFYGGKNQDRFTVQNANVVLSNFRLDTSTVIFSRNHKLFEHIDFTIDEYAYFLPDSIHRLYIKSFRFSTQDSVITGDSMVIAPIQGLSQQWFAEKADMQKRFYVPSFKLSGVELWKGWENKDLVVGKLEVEGSEFFLKRLNDPKKDIGFRDVANFYPYINHIFKSIAVDSLLVEESEVYFYDRDRQRFSSPAIQVAAYSFFVDSLTQLDTSKFFHAEDLVVSMGSSRILLPDESHILEVGNFAFSPIKGVYEVENLAITPFTPSGWSAEGEIRRMKMTSFFLKEFLVSGEWLADSVILYGPHVKVSSFNRRRRLENSALGKVEVGTLEIREGSFSLNLGDTVTVGLEDYSFSVDHLAYDLQAGESWKVDNASAGVGLFELLLPGSKNLRMKSVGFSLSDSLLTSGEAVFEALAAERGLRRLGTPQVTITGLDFRSAIKGNFLKWKDATFGPASVEWGIGTDADGERNLEQSLNDLKAVVLGDYRFVQGRHIHFPLEVLTLHGDSSLPELADVNFDFHDIYLNQRSAARTSPLGFARDISVKTGRQDFSWGDAFDTLRFDEFRLSTQGEILEVKNLRLAMVKPSLSTFAPEFSIAGLDWQALVWNNRLEADTLRANLQYLLVEAGQEKLQTNPPPGKKSGPPVANAVIGYIDIVGETLNYRNPAKDRMWDIPSFEIELSGFSASEDQTMDERLLYSKEYKVALNDLSFLLPDSLYRLQMERFSVNSSEPQIVIEGPSVMPIYGMYEHARKVGHQTNWIQTKGQRIAFYEPNLFGLLQGDELTARKVSMDYFFMRLFRDKRVPFPEDQVRGLPQLALLDLALPVEIDSFFITNSSILYQEFAQEGTEPGELVISELNARGTNITNRAAAIEKNQYANLHARALMLDEGLLNADFVFDLTSKAGTHYVTGTIGPTDLTKTNTILEPTAFVQVKEGKLNEAYFNFEADTAVAVGNMDFLYNDLKVSVLSKKQEKQGSGKALETFFANTFIVSSNNPTLFSTRQGGIFFERDTSRSIINYWTKAFLSGIVSSIGAKSNKDKIRQWQQEVYEKNATQENGTNER